MLPEPDSGGKRGKAHEAGTIPDPTFALSFYHTFDFVKGCCEYTTGFGYCELPDTPLPDGLIRGEVVAHRALHVDHTGPYRHLGNAWSAAMGCQRSEKHKPNKRIPPYEIYLSKPGDVEEEDIKTSIYIPVK
jgi:predicted transcriptional regulator YdeE